MFPWQIIARAAAAMLNTMTRAAAECMGEVAAPIKKRSGQICSLSAFSKVFPSWLDERLTPHSARVVSINKRMQIMAFIATSF